jgi:hypothetical protein
MINLKIYILVAVLFTCCCKASIYSETIIANESNHTIEIIPYQNGIANNEMYQFIESMKEKRVYESRSGAYYVYEFSLVDSIMVVFDTNVKAVHYSPRITNGKNSKSLKFDNPRNFFNQENYSCKIDQSKCSSKSNCNYRFTEQDYLDAE